MSADTSREAVERKAAWLVAAAGQFSDLPAAARDVLESSAATLRALLSRAERAEAERDAAVIARDKAQAVLDGRMSDLTELRLKELHLAGGSFDMQFQAGIIPIIGAFLVAEFKNSGATNYLAIECNTEELGPMVLTIQRKWGEQPAQVAAKEREARRHAEAERDEARRACAIYEADIGCIEEERDAARAEAERMREVLKRIERMAETAEFNMNQIDVTRPIAIRCVRQLGDEARAALAAKEPGHE